MLKCNNMSVSLLLICPDKSSTTIAVSEDDVIVYQSKIDHSKSDFILFDNIMEQLPYRRDAVIYQLRIDSVDVKKINYAVAEGGLLKPCKSGVYYIDKMMVSDLIDEISGSDIINIGGLLAFSVANVLRIKSLVVDPASVDERSELASFCPHPSIKKKSLFHAMIHKYLSKKYADSIGKNYNELNLILCHVNERSVSVAAHKKAKIVDVNQAFMGCGPMGLCEAGTIPSSALFDMLFIKHYSKNEVFNVVKNNASYYNDLKTNSLDDIISSYKDNKKIKSLLDAMAYQIAKEIASHYVTLDNEIDAIILSGKIFTINRFLKYIYKRIEKLAPVIIFTEDYNMKALIFNVMDYVNNKKDFLFYG